MFLRRVPLRLLFLLLFAAVFVACDPVVDSNPPITVDPTAESITMPGAQVPTANGVITISRVLSNDKGWLVLVADDGSGAPGQTILGQRSIDSGITTNLTVGLIEAVDNGDRVWGVLYRDSGQVGIFEPAGSDRRAIAENGLDVKASTYIRWLSVEDQILENNYVTLDTVRSASPIWMTISASDLSGNPTVIIGREHSSFGTVSGMKILLDTAARRAVIDGDRLWVTMYADNGAIGTFEPGVDIPFSYLSRPVTQRIRIGASYAPLIEVSNQPISASAITVQRVEATKVGWIVIREAKADGTPNMAGSIGRARVNIGVNTQIGISLSKQVSSGTKLWAMLHEDTGSLGKYEYTASGVVDVPILVGGQPVAEEFSIQ
jgi:hypothetical protein